MEMSQMKVSRRKFMAAGAASLAVTQVPLTYVWAQNATSEFAHRQLEFTPASAPAAFEEKLAQYFPQLLRDPHFQLLMPMCCIIENQSTLAIKAHSTTWILRGGEQVYQTTVQQFFTPRYKHSGSPNFGRTGNKTRMTGQVDLLKPKGVRLISPLFSWSPAYVTEHPNLNWAKLNRNAKTDLLFDLIPTLTSVSVSLEAVIFADHVVLGADRSNLARSFRVRRNAEHDEASSILHMVKANASLSSIQAKLQYDADLKTDPDGNVVTRKNPNAYLYRMTRRKQAKLLLRRLTRHGYQKFSRTLHYLAKQPKTVTTQLS